MSDLRLFEELADLNREEIPERVWFAKGAGAAGQFRPYMNMQDYTIADFLSDPEKETPVFVRFSMAAGRKGSADTQRDNRGFSVRFYTEEGNYDLMGTSLPVFYIENPKEMPALLASLKPSPKTNIREPERFWRFYGEHPEAIHLLTWLYSDLGTMKSYRTMAGHSVLPCLWTGRTGIQYLVRYHWRPLAGEKTITANEAEFLAGFDPDVAARDLYHTLEEGIPAEYELEIQIASRELALQPGIDLMNPTLIWEEERFPLTKVGKMTLDRVPEDYAEEVEGIAFSPGNTVRGIEITDHELCKAVVFAAEDAHRYRLGRRYKKMAANRARGPQFRAEPVKGSGGFRKNGDICADPLIQAGERLQRMGEEERNCLAMAIAQEILFLDEEIQTKIVAHLRSAHEDFGNVVAERIGL